MNTLKKPQHFLDISEYSTADLRKIMDASKQIKATRNGVNRGQGLLAGKVLVMVFEQPSTRTRISFDVGMRELGGETLMLTGAEMQLGRGESIPDTARVLSRFVDMIMIRMLDHDAVKELAEYASVPVINGLTKISHPCQIMADILTSKNTAAASRAKPFPGWAIATTFFIHGLMRQQSLTLKLTSPHQMN